MGDHSRQTLGATKPQREHGSTSPRRNPASHRDASVIFLHQILSNPQAETGAANSFGCKEGLEQPAKRSGIHACASVSHRNAQFGVTV